VGIKLAHTLAPNIHLQKWEFEVWSGLSPLKL
jgi:hypothetical protein